MSIIEQAAKRLEELRRAGVQLPGSTPAPVQPPAIPTIFAPKPVESPVDLPTVVRPVLPGVPPLIEPAVAPALNDMAFDPARPQSKRIEIDLARLAANGYITPDAARSQLADQYRVIKRPLLTNALGKSANPVERSNLIMITSSMPGEGKTFTSINLALSIAMELDCRVLLVDADVARPVMLERLGLPKAKGLLDVLTQPGLEVGDVMMRTNVDRLSLLPAGTHHPRATELLASDGMKRLLAELGTRYRDRVLVFDAPPLLPSTESRVLATQMGQVVVVVEAERTQCATVLGALATIESCPVVMTLLNKVTNTDPHSYYGYYGDASAS